MKTYKVTLEYRELNGEKALITILSKASTKNAATKKALYSLWRRISEEMTKTCQLFSIERI